MLKLILSDHVEKKPVASLVLWVTLHPSSARAIGSCKSGQTWHSSHIPVKCLAVGTRRVGSLPKLRTCFLGVHSSMVGEM